MSHHKVKILVVEDDPDLRGAYSTILLSSGYDVSTAQNGQDAFSVLEKMEGEPQIIFLDLRMPVMNGIEFLKAYKAETHPQVKIVIFSNYDAQTEVDQAYELGADRYVLKARATPNELLRIVRDITA